MAQAVNWELARRVAVRVAGQEPLANSYLYDSLQPDFDRLTAEAESLVAAETGLHSLAGPARGRVTDRAGWVNANVASFQRLLRPLTEKIGTRLEGNPMASITRAVAGVELGTLLGWMATRVLGQYDLLLVEDDRPEDQDIVYYVGPNVLALEKRFAFPPEEFRLWLALHEVTHRAQFTGIPWMREHFVGLVDGVLSGVDLDARHFIDAIGRAVEEVRAGRNPLDEGGLAAIFASADQREALNQVQGLMSLLEGHGDVTMDRAGAGRIPSADRFSSVLHERRASVQGPARFLQKLIGLESKLRQYEDGERFIEAVERVGGHELLARAWQGAEWLPTRAEIQDPQSWIARVRPAIPASL